MSTLETKLGCQTFTWEMLGERWSGGPDDLLAAIAAGGYSGIEITDTMIGHYAENAVDFSVALATHGLELAAFAFGSASGFTERRLINEDLETAMRWIEFMREFPSVPLALGSATIVSDGPRQAKFEVAAELYNRVGELGAAAGVDVAIHPSSHHGTLLLDRSDYDQLFELLDPIAVGWVPDTGHILRGDHDLLDTLRSHQSRIRYVHLKDVDDAGDWAMLGQGRCDVSAVIELAVDAPRFNGWIVVEEESLAAAADPAGAVRRNRETLTRMGY